MDDYFVRSGVIFNFLEYVVPSYGALIGLMIQIERKLII